jgi:hypothetical protein
MNDILWVRWYKLYADGMTPKREQDYEYKFYNKSSDNITEISNYIESDLKTLFEDDYEYESFHYRGIKWEYIDRPPIWHIERQMVESNNAIKFHLQSLDFYQQQLDILLQEVDKCLP